MAALPLFAPLGLLAFLSACSSSDSNPPVSAADTNNMVDTIVMTDSGSAAANDGESINEQLAETMAPDQSQASDQDPNQPNSTQLEHEARYRVTFEADWTSGSHSVGYPVGPHFSGLVGAVHNEQVVFWQPGQIASDGIEFMAETGGKSIFLTEINSAIESGTTLSSIDGSGIPSGEGVTSVDVVVSIDYPQITITTMLAPSPDWFAGFHVVNLFDGGVFLEQLEIDAVLYDAGTDSGRLYQSADEDAQPRDPILRVNSEPQDTPFIDGEPAVGRFTIERMM